MLRMPATFGPRTGPRRGPDGQAFENSESPRETTITISFLSNETQLEDLLPQNFTLRGEPVVSVSATYTTDIEWLAGRGYNKLGVRIPASFKGDRDEVAGDFLSVLWENLPDAILTGRDELGVPKIWCELPEPRITESDVALSASWLGFRFLEMSITDLRGSEPSGEPRDSAGDLHLKYVPKTGGWGEADICYATHIPSENPNRRVLECRTGVGQLKFHAARWQDMPTQFNIVNRLAELEIVEFCAATVTKSVGGKDLSDAQILR